MSQLQQLGKSFLCSHDKSHRVSHLFLSFIKTPPRQNTLPVVSLLFEVMFVEYKTTQRGRPRYGSEKRPPYARLGITLPQEILERLDKYCGDEERDRSFAIKRALDDWLKERGY